MFDTLKEKEDARLKLIAAILPAVIPANALTLDEDDQVDNAQNVALFSVGLADSILQIVIDNPYQHIDTKSN